jgi:hypothetical protein
VLSRVPHSLEHTNKILVGGVELNEDVHRPSHGVGCIGIDSAPGACAVFVDVVLQEELEDVGHGEDVLVRADAAAEGFGGDGDGFPRG